MVIFHSILLPNFSFETGTINAPIIVEFLPQIKPKDFINTKREFLMDKIQNQISR